MEHSHDPGGRRSSSTSKPAGGTEYDASQDLARLDLTRESLPEPVEQFTIAIESADSGGVLRMSWDATSYLVPFTIARPR